MLVGQHLVPVVVDMRLIASPQKLMLMLVMLIMPMGMQVLKRFVGMCVFMPLTHVKPHAQRHQGCRNPEQRARHFRPENEISTPKMGATEK